MALTRIWVPLVIVVVVAVGGFVIFRFHGVFGSQQPASGETRTENIVSTVPKYVTYEVNGPANSAGMISYVDEHAQPQEAHFTTLP